MRKLKTCCQNILYTWAQTYIPALPILTLVTPFGSIDKIILHVILHLLMFYQRLQFRAVFRGSTLIMTTTKAKTRLSLQKTKIWVGILAPVFSTTTVVSMTISRCFRQVTTVTTLRA